MSERGMEFGGSKRIEAELRANKEQLQRRRATYVLKVRKEDLAHRIDDEVRSIRDQLSREFPIRAHVLTELGPDESEGPELNYQPVRPVGLEVDEKDLLSQGEIYVIGGKLAEAMKAETVVKLRSEDRMKLVTPGNYVVHNGLEGVWPTSVNGPMRLDKLLGVASREAGDRLKFRARHVALPEADQGFNFGPENPVEALRRYLNGSSDFRVLAVLREVLFGDKGTITLVLNGFQRSVSMPWGSDLFDFSPYTGGTAKIAWVKRGNGFEIGSVETYDPYPGKYPADQFVNSGEQLLGIKE